MQDKKQAIFQAVIQLTDAVGNPGELTISQIAQQAGIGKGTVYEYFSSKEQVLWETVFHFVDCMLQAMEASVRQGTFQQRFTQMLGTVREYMTANKTFFVSVFLNQNFGSLPGEFAQQAQEKKEQMHRRLFQLLYELLEQGKREEVICRENSKLDLTFAFLAMMGAMSQYSFGCENFVQVSITQEEMFQFLYEKFVRLLK